MRDGPVHDVADVALRTTRPTWPYENDSVNRICDRRILCILIVSVSFKNRLFIYEQ